MFIKNIPLVTCALVLPSKLTTKNTTTYVRTYTNTLFEYNESFKGQYWRKEKIAAVCGKTCRKVPSLPCQAVCTRDGGIYYLLICWLNSRTKMMFATCSNLVDRSHAHTRVPTPSYVVPQLTPLNYSYILQIVSSLAS